MTSANKTGETRERRREWSGSEWERAAGDRGGTIKRRREFKKEEER